MRVGITGHQRLKDPSGWTWVKADFTRILARCPPPLIGVTSLAIGADQLFAGIILQLNGTFEVIVPFERYASKFVEGHDKEEYQRLLQLASRVEVLPEMASEEHAYFEAGKRVVDLTELLIAVWDGKPAAGLGGTADVVAYARASGKDMIHINPIDHSVAE